MQSLAITGLKELVAALDAAPGVIREARAEFFEEAGAQLLADVQSRIGGTGRVAGVQEYRVGSGKGYVAVHAKAKTDLDGYAAGYVANALENGPPSGSPLGRPSASGPHGQGRPLSGANICTGIPGKPRRNGWRRLGPGASKSPSLKL